ncbi:MAG: glutamate racemase [Sulfurospirillaceae bacterium]|nr:glutamate racemase [Sulfurospirillaceae bacterium]MDD3462250.1 glutamate racemase [Sulfurospirillaceae bacterium]
MKAGVFDSGVGGLSVVKSLIEHNVFDEIVYYGDTARVPYGVKDKNTIIRYSLEALEFFKNFDIDILITACNTVSAYAIEELRETAPFNVVGVIEPGVIATCKKLRDKNADILVLGTKATVKSGKYSRLLQEKGYTNINSLAPSLFVPIVEEGIFEGELLQTTMQYYFANIEKDPDAIILGCTHFPMIFDALQKYFPKSTLIHSGEAIVEYLESKFNFSHSTEKTKLMLFSSENPDGLKTTAKQWLQTEI